jgi:hypothetical protein
MRRISARLAIQLLKRTTLFLEHGDQPDEGTYDTACERCPRAAFHRRWWLARHQRRHHGPHQNGFKKLPVTLVHSKAFADIIQQNPDIVDNVYDFRMFM